MVLPGETAPPTAGARMAYGGTPDADDALGRRVWPVLQNLLDGAARRAR